MNMGGLSIIYCFVQFLSFFFYEVGKILFVENLVEEKRKERLHIGECRRTWKPVIPQFLSLVL
jgi:hypothetical protein